MSIIECIYDEQCAKLRQLIGKTYADRIINEVKPESNVYTLSHAIKRMGTIIQVAAAGVTPKMLLEFVKNFQEECVLLALCCGYAFKTGKKLEDEDGK